MYYQNTRGICTKLHNIYAMSHDTNFDIICFTETWLHSAINNHEIFTSNYNVFRQDRKFVVTGRNVGGGVLTAISISTLKTNPVDLGDISNLAPLVDACVTKWSLHNVTFYVVNIYIPPDTNNSDLDNFLSALSLHLLNKPLIIIGDFNTHHFDFNTLATDPRSIIT